MYISLINNPDNLEFKKCFNNNIITYPMILSFFSLRAQEKPCYKDNFKVNVCTVKIKTD